MTVVHIEQIEIHIAYWIKINVLHTNDIHDYLWFTQIIKIDTYVCKFVCTYVCITI